MSKFNLSTRVATLCSISIVEIGQSIILISPIVLIPVWQITSVFDKSSVSLALIALIPKVNAAAMSVSGADGVASLILLSRSARIEF